MKRFAVALLVVLSLLVGTVGAGAATSSSCSNVVKIDAFRFDNSTVSKAANDSAAVSVRNTNVEVEQSTGFVRIDAKNPNGYCNEFHVRMSSAIVSPAELGEVDSTNSNATADWHARHDLSTGETYTEVVFVLGSGETATFAPSKLRVQSLSWTGTAKRESESLLGRFSNLSIGPFERPQLRERTYEFSPENDSAIVTISLTNETDGRTIEEWHAMSRTPETDWRPVGTDADAPVFYRKVGADRIQFIFNDEDARVQFVANPSTLDKASYQFDSYTSGLDVLEDLLEVPDVFQ